MNNRKSSAPRNMRQIFHADNPKLWMSVGVTADYNASIQIRSQHFVPTIVHVPREALADLIRLLQDAETHIQFNYRELSSPQESGENHDNSSSS